jgi:hypothetical protein
MISYGGMITPVRYATLGRMAVFFLLSQRFLRPTPLPQHQASAFDDQCLRQTRTHLKWLLNQSAGIFAKLVRGKVALALRRYHLAVAAMRKYFKPEAYHAAEQRYRSRRG